MLPGRDIRRDTILTIIQQQDHGVRVHALADKELKVLEAADNLLGVAAGLGLKVLDLVVGGAIRLERLLDLLHVGLEVGEVRLLVEAGGLQPEGVRDVVDRLGAVLDVVVGGLLARRVRANVHVHALADGDGLALDLVHDAVDLLVLVGVGEDLVAGDDVLESGGKKGNVSFLEVEENGEWGTESEELYIP
jgi:hypothetical protein